MFCLIGKQNSHLFLWENILAQGQSVHFFTHKTFISDSAEPVPPKQIIYTAEPYRPESSTRWCRYQEHLQNALSLI